MYMLIGFILSISLSISISRYRQRCYGILKMIWSSRDSLRLYCVSLVKTSVPRYAVMAFACGTREDGVKYIAEALGAFPNVFVLNGLHMKVDGMWAMFGPESGSIDRYAPDNACIRKILRMSYVKEDTIDSFIDWTNRYWHNYIINYING